LQAQNGSGYKARRLYATLETCGSETLVDLFYVDLNVTSENQEACAGVYKHFNVTTCGFPININVSNKGKAG
jgi:hypothetical protein